MKPNIKQYRPKCWVSLRSTQPTRLVAPLIEAVKELKAENDDLKKEIAHIKKKLATNSDILR